MSGAQHGKTQYVSSVVMYEQCGSKSAMEIKKEKALEMLHSPEYGLLLFTNREVA